MAVCFYGQFHGKFRRFIRHFFTHHNVSTLDFFEVIIFFPYFELECLVILRQYVTFERLVENPYYCCRNHLDNLPNSTFENVAFGTADNHCFNRPINWEQSCPNATTPAEYHECALQFGVGIIFCYLNF